MDREDFVRQISALRRGELQLEAPEENGLSRFAGGALYELRQYISALEAGYRKLWGMMESSMDKVNAGGTTLGGLIRNQWSDEAALGYAYMACTAAGIRPDKTVVILEHMGEIMGRVGRQDAAAVHRGLVGGDEATPPPPAAVPLPCEQGRFERPYMASDARRYGGTEDGPGDPAPTGDTAPRSKGHGPAGLAMTAGDAV